jgi:hypothetical protein
MFDEGFELGKAPVGCGVQGILSAWRASGDVAGAFSTICDGPPVTVSCEAGRCVKSRPSCFEIPDAGPTPDYVDESSDAGAPEP